MNPRTRRQRRHARRLRRVESAFVIVICQVFGATGSRTVEPGLVLHASPAIAVWSPEELAAAETALDAAERT